jgi:hypothetical protein
MQRRLLFLLAMLALCCTTQIFAAPGIAFTLNSIKTNSDIIAGLPLPTGADLTLELPLGSTSTAFTLRAAAGYESRMILRSTATMFPIAEPPAIDGVNRFFWTNALAELGVKQYLLHKEHEQAWLFGLVRGRYENNSPSFPTTLFPDAQAVRSASGVGGIAFDSIRWLGKNEKREYRLSFHMSTAPILPISRAHLQTLVVPISQPKPLSLYPPAISQRTSRFTALAIMPLAHISPMKCLPPSGVSLAQKA